MTPEELKAKAEAEKQARARKYDDEIQRLYYNAIDKAAQAAQGTTLQPGLFYLLKYPSSNLAVNNIIKDLTSQINILTFNAINSEWNRADLANDHLFNTLLNPNGGKSELLSGRNQDAYNQFVVRKDGQGLNLSKRIFNSTETFKQELETGLGEGITNGTSARQIASNLKQYLNEPDMLFRRVRQDGKLKLSKAALDYHPGQGVYRSSFKNSLRVTRTEINMSYRKSDS